MSDEDKGANPRPWARQTGESSKARDAFLVYLKMGPARSLRRVVEKMKRPAGYRRTLERWSSQWDWVERVNAFDERALDEIERLLPAIRRDELRLMAERARDSGEEIWKIAQGIFDSGSKYPVRNHHGKVIGHKPSIPPATRLKAATRVREEIGIIPPKRLEMSGRDGEEIKLAAATARGLDDEALVALRSAAAALVAARGQAPPANVIPEEPGEVGIGPSYQDEEADAGGGDGDGDGDGE